MNDRFKKFLSYYKPYLGLFFAIMTLRIDCIWYFTDLSIINKIYYKGCIRSKRRKCAQSNLCYWCDHAFVSSCTNCV